VVDGCQAVLDYVAGDGATTRRVVHPLGLALKGSTWYLVAGTDNGQRTFRVDRMRSVEVMVDPVERPEGFDLADAWAKVVADIDERRAPVRARALTGKGDLSFLRYVFGKRVLIGASGPDERVEVELRGASARVLAAEIAGFGGSLEVTEPLQVRECLARIASELSELYRPPRPGSDRKVQVRKVLDRE
jgi:predicted DNA-binding transcriptional regulator YafY